MVKTTLSHSLAMGKEAPDTDFNVPPDGTKTKSFISKSLLCAWTCMDINVVKLGERWPKINIFIGTL